MASFWKLKFSSFSALHSSWRGTFERARHLKGLCLKVPLVVLGSLSVEVGLAASYFVKQVSYLYRESGPLFTALYLKQCRVSLQRYYAGSPGLHQSLAVQIRLTRCGLPRIIPPYHRKVIRVGDERADKVVRMYLSWLDASRLIALAPKVTSKTFASIVAPLKDIGRLKEVLGEIKTEFPKLISMYCPWLQYIPFNKGMTWVPTWKSTPMFGKLFLLGAPKGPDGKPVIPIPGAEAPMNIFSNLKHELAAFASNVNKIHSLPEGVFSPGILFPPAVLYPLDNKVTTMLANSDLTKFENSIGPTFATLLSAYEEEGLRTGRLGSSVEGGGKRRLFVIGNYVKQRLLFPVHQWGMTVLRHLPTDGTFDQNAPIRRLSALGPMDVYSFDLKSATDRWPLPVIHDVMSCIFGPTMASSIVNGALGLNSVWVDPPLVRSTRVIHFLAGQALGYYGSWALFALTHHYIVWLSAKRAYPSSQIPFKSYAILGDDLVIADTHVAREYTNLLDALGVEVSVGKSLISHTGCLEFARKFWVKRVSCDLSPVSLKALSGRTLLDLCALQEKYNIQDRVVMFRLAGAGYKVRARMDSHQSLRWERVKAIMLRPRGSNPLPIEWWIGRQKPINPYLKGRLVDYLLRHPKELKLPPKGVLFDGELEILERTVIRNWMASWLRWLQWYHTTKLKGDISLEDLDPPWVSLSWKRSSFDPDRKKAGLLWRIYDLGEGRDLGSGFNPAIGGPTGSGPGGIRGDSFILIDFHPVDGDLPSPSMS